jgi:hypothetical protein
LKGALVLYVVVVLGVISAVYVLPPFGKPCLKSS